MYAEVHAAISHNPELCALYALLNFSDRMPAEARSVLAALQAFLLDPQVPEDADGLHALDLRLNDLGESGRKLALQYYENDKSISEDDARVRYATHFLLMALRKLASAAWAAARARTNSLKRQDAHLASTDVVMACLESVAFLEVDVRGEGQPKASACFAEMAPKFREIPVFPAEPQGLRDAASSNPVLQRLILAPQER